MTTQQKRILAAVILGGLILIVTALVVTRSPEEAGVAAVQTQMTAPEAAGQAANISPVTSAPVPAPAEVKKLDVSDYAGVCAMPDGGLMYGTVVGLDDDKADPATLASVHLRNNVTGEAVVIDVKAGACKFEKQEKAP